MTAIKLPNGEYVLQEEVVAVTRINPKTIHRMGSVHTIGKTQEGDPDAPTTRIYLRRDAQPLLTSGDPDEIAYAIFGSFKEVVALPDGD